MLFVPPFIPAEAQSEPYMGAIVELDKAVYSWTDVVWIYITAPNFNSEPTEIDYIGCGGNIHIVGDKNQCSQSLITITATNVVNNVSMGIEKLDYYVLAETGPDTGIFWGTVFLTGFPHDVDGDGKDDPYKLYQNQYFNENILSVLDMKANEDLTGTTSGTGPWDGRIKVNPGNTITVKFTNLLQQYSGYTRIVDAKAEVNFWIGEFGDLIYSSDGYILGPVESDNESYIIRAGEPVTITIRDPDRNMRPFTVDWLTVNVYSDSDPVGIQLDLRAEELVEFESDISAFWQDSGLFHGEVIFSDAQSDQPENYDFVFAKHGDAITFEYADCTLPQASNLDWKGLECVTLTSKAKMIPGNVPTPIGETLLEQIIPLHERFSSVNARVLDEFGELLPTSSTYTSPYYESVVSVYEVTVGQQIQIVADITNEFYNEQSFAYSVMVSGYKDIARQEFDSDLGFDEGVKFTEGSLDQGESASPAVSWTPSAPGSYTALLAVFDCWECDSTRGPLAPLQSIDIDVLPKTVEPVTAIPGWIKNNAGWWADGQIDDSSFLQGIQFLIKEGIMVIPPTEASGTSGSEGVPAWVKNNAGWWAEGQIDDSSFLQGIQYLVKEGIIKVS